MTSRARCSGLSRPIAAGATSDMMRAPCEPPVTSSRSLPSVKSGKGSAAASITAGRTGLPTCTTFARKASGDAVERREAAGDDCARWREEAVGAAHHRVLLVQDQSEFRARTRQARAARSDSRRTHHRARLDVRRAAHRPGRRPFIRVSAASPLPRAAAASASPRRSRGSPRRENRCHISAPARRWRGAPARRARSGRAQSLGGKQMAAGAPGGDEDEIVLRSFRGRPDRRSRRSGRTGFPISAACGSRRSGSPCRSPSEISDEPP